MRLSMSMALLIILPVGWMAGEEHPLQAFIGPFGGPGSALTNLMMLVVE